MSAPFRLSGTYRPQLDGVRAVAVAAVVASHAALPHAAKGGHGVDVFFVLSGFLITSLLIEEIADRGRIDIRAFYRGRWRRLSPALFAMLAITAPLFAIVRPFHHHETLVGVLTSILYVSAWARALGADLGWLGHTWSLSVEEVFYLAWPALLILLLRFRSRVSATALLVCFAIAVAYRAAAIVLGVDGNWLYNAPDMRAEQLLAGCALAGILHHPRAFTFVSARATLLRVLGVLGAAYLVLDLSDLPGTIDWYRGGSTAIAVATAALIAWLVVLARDLPARLLASAPLVWVGMRSYGIYLWHLPLFGLLALKDESSATRAAGRAVALVLTLVAAEVSLRTIEGKARHRRDRPTSLEPVTG